MTPPLSLRAQAQVLKPREIDKIAAKGHGYSKGLQWVLPFYKAAVTLVELTDEAVLPARRDYYIKDDNGVTKLAFEPGFVEGLAMQHGLALSRDTVDDYIRFYTGATRGAAGRVLPIDIIDELPLREELTLITRRKLQELITPLTAIDAKSATGCFLIRDKLVKAKVTIGKGGGVELEAVAFLADTLPVTDSVLEP